jgi:hypothetical protein
MISKQVSRTLDWIACLVFDFEAILPLSMFQNDDVRYRYSFEDDQQQKYCINSLMNPTKLSASL